MVVNRKGEGVSLDPAKTTTMEDYMVMENIYGSLVPVSNPTRLI